MIKPTDCNRLTTSVKLNTSSWPYYSHGDPPGLIYCCDLCLAPGHPTSAPVDALRCQLGAVNLDEDTPGDSGISKSHGFLTTGKAINRQGSGENL
ncbi:hypothetical protein PoB_007193300 [Plakobranchus ocellatus]|uniref:Uncharacterized protein n=1 Tax=Plakobranchus ocellatus TaxID=259542 RepID=A0AAV4DMX7_9GAST|nr:hypothetical protein PoB_007193300 [Plakobranchus ocellatus]